MAPPGWNSILQQATGPIPGGTGSTRFIIITVLLTEILAGDIIVIPAGVGHKSLESDNLGVVGAYPDGRSWDINRGLPGERPQTDHNIAALPIPVTDPLLGRKEGLVKWWKN
jgi:uncharacterized protein YjlB